MSNWNLKKIDSVKESLIDSIIMNSLQAPTDKEIMVAKKAIKKYDSYVERLKQEEYQIDIPRGVQEFIGVVQTSGIKTPTQNMAIAHLIDCEKRLNCETLVYAVDAGITIASYLGPSTKSQKNTELDIRKYMNFETGKPKMNSKTFKGYLPTIYKAIYECLKAGGVK